MGENLIDLLQTGRLVKYRSGKTALVLVGDFKMNSNSNTQFILTNHDGHIDSSWYKSNLNCKGGMNDWDIIEIYSSNSNINPGRMLELSIGRRELIWKRAKVETIEIGGIKYSKEEVEDKLKNLKPIE